MEPELTLILAFAVAIIFQVIYVKYRDDEMGLLGSGVAFISWASCGPLALLAGEASLMWLFYGLCIVNIPLLIYTIYLLGIRSTEVVYEVNIGD